MSKADTQPLDLTAPAVVANEANPAEVTLSKAAVRQDHQAIDADVWEAAVDRVNAWRGQALQHFAVAEAAASETLLLMASLPRGGANVRLRRLVGQRFEDLAIAIGADGPFAKEGSRAREELAAFLQHETLRTFLCHGIAKVAVDRHGHWIVIFKVLAFRGRAEERSSMALEKREAEAALDDLKAASQKLTSRLQSLRARISDRS